MRTDRELLELAAKAAGFKSFSFHDMRGWGEVRYGLSEAIYVDDDEIQDYWNPLTNSGDALRLMASLRLVVHVWDDEDQVSAGKTFPGAEDPPCDGDAWHCATAHAQGSIEAATRRAIVLAAAEIGAYMP